MMANINGIAMNTIKTGTNPFNQNNRSTGGIGNEYQANQRHFNAFQTQANPAPQTNPMFNFAAHA